MEHLFDKLHRYGTGDVYPYHMPGHKRRPWGELPEGMYRTDITEIDGFDNLHQPEEILLELQKKAAEIYDAEESYYLVNGSTCGILAAVSCAVSESGHILIARNCHKSVYHGAYLRNLKLSYLWPDYIDEYGICDAVTPEQVQRALDEEQDLEAVLIVSPTYEGRIADIGTIAEIVHKRGLPLIVDEAHGAHLGLAEGFAPNSCQLGADLVIHSVHKTLPSLTQTALLHVNGNRVNRERLRRFLRIYQSSSPSYLLMASIDNALQYVETEGQEAFRHFKVQYGEMVQTLLGRCRCLSFPGAEEANGERAKTYGVAGTLGLRQGPNSCRRQRTVQDIGKLVISVKGTGLTGKQLYDILLSEYHLQPEMAAESYVLAMFTVNDGEEAYRRMTEALLEIDGRIADGPGSADGNSGTGFAWTDSCEGGYTGKQEQDKVTAGLAPELYRKALPISEAWDMPMKMVKLEDSIGRYAGEFVNLYPPGIPLLVPGEKITEDLYRSIRKALEQGLKVQGIRERKTASDLKEIFYLHVLSA